MGNVISRGEGSSLHLQSKALLISENWQKASAKKRNGLYRTMSIMRALNHAEGEQLREKLRASAKSCNFRQRDIW